MTDNRWGKEMIEGENKGEGLMSRELKRNRLKEENGKGSEIRTCLLLAAWLDVDARQRERMVEKRKQTKWKVHG